MVNEYTPDAHNVRAAWIETGIGSEDALIAEFDRWLVKVKADAWDEGRAAAMRGGILSTRRSNPYRDGADQ